MKSNWDIITIPCKKISFILYYFHTFISY